MVIPVQSFNFASEADKLPLSERADNFDANGFKKTIDQRTFSDFNIDGSEKDWRQDAINVADNNTYNGKKKENDKLDDLRDAVDLANDLQEARQEFMHSINGRHFSDADLEEALNDIIENKEEFQTKHDLTDEEADIALKHAVIMKSMTPEQRDNYLKDLSETNPTVANAIADQSEAKAISQDNKVDLVESYSESSELDDMLEDPKVSQDSIIDQDEGVFEALTKEPSTGTTDIFNSLANTSATTPEITSPEPDGTNNIPAPVI